MKQKTSMFRFTQTELEYFNNLSTSMLTPKKSIIDLTSHWLDKQDELPKLDFTSDYNAIDNKWVTLNVRCKPESNEILKQKASEYGVTRYELVEALIKKVPELLKPCELFDYKPLQFENFKRKDD